MKKFAISIFLCLILTTSSFFAPTVSAYTLPPDLEIHARSVYMINLETGTVVYQKDPTAQMFPASVTKLMTALVALEQCPDLQKPVTVYPQVVDDLLGTGAAVAGLLGGEQVTMEQLLHLLLIPSSCDAANAIAMEISGSVEEFVKLMNAKAAALGMTNTLYANAHGLHEEIQTTTAYDQYLLATEIIKHKELTDICCQYNYTMPATNFHEERTFPTTNYMINPYSSWYYKRVQGLKTGYTDDAGRNLVSLAEKDGQRYITVVLGCPADTLNGYQVHHEFDNTYDLLFWAYTDLEYMTVVETTKPVAEAKVTLCRETDHVIAVPAEDFHAMIPKDSLDSVIVTPHLTKEEWKAPVEKGTVLGTATVTCAGEEIGTIDLVAKETCKRSFILLIWDWLTHPVCLVIYGIVALAIIVFAVWNVRVNYRRRKLWNSKARRR
ncbi:MAG: D-alanyl-D-alanine carboxypeptidase [Clostridia bacterium]|nr:D-alanyl-D-alanine carboxypeptidase [Clostridia bacterium]